MREIFWGRLGAAVFEGSWTNTLMEMNASKIALGVVIFVVGLAASFAAAAFILTRLPPDYFSNEKVELWPDRPDWQRAAGRVGKNVLGVVLVVVGVLLSFPGVPGQGFLTIFIGIILVDFPGKRRLERRVMKMPRVFKACNKLRVRWKRAPFLAPEEPEDR